MSILMGGGTYFTMFREPIARIISLYNYANETPILTYHSELKEKKLSIVEFCKSGMAPTADNGMTRFVSGNFIDTVPYGKCDEQMLETAKRNLDNHFAVVGLQEKFDLSMLLFHKVLGFEKYPFYEYKNKTQKKKESKLDNTQLNEIMPYIKYDIELYNYAKELFETKIKKYPELEQSLKIYSQANKMKESLSSKTKQLNTSQKELKEIIKSAIYKIYNLLRKKDK